ncbi:MAG: HAD family hydrolase [Lachnospiraceae bacterium]|nr:HAD family hydrolase [Lachnospiraceae bacterium]
MRKRINEYKVYVFDLDGTLYDQPKLRTLMALRLIRYYLFHPFAVRQLYILRYFRKVKDSWTGSSCEDEIIKKVASDINTDADSVRMIVRKWIYDEPLSVIGRTRDRRIGEWIEKLQKAGKTVLVLSDYPTQDKLRALSLSVGGQYCTADERIGQLKPSPKGLFVIMEDFGVSPEDILMIGDREEKDGECAKGAGADCLILPRHIGRRTLDYEI